LAATSITRRKLRGSTGPPSSVVNTRPLPLPLIARPQPLGLLLGAVLAQHRNDGERHGHRAPRAIGLGLGDRQGVAYPRDRRSYTALSSSGPRVARPPTRRTRASSLLRWVPDRGHILGTLGRNPRESQRITFGVISQVTSCFDVLTWGTPRVQIPPPPPQFAFGPAAHLPMPVTAHQALRVRLTDVSAWTFGATHAHSL
jgi:hypothetical protein